MFLDDFELFAEGVGSINEGFDFVFNCNESLWLFLFAFIFVNIVALDSTVFIEVDDGLQPVFELLAVSEAESQIHFTSHVRFFSFLVNLDFP